ncbi:MAG: hypothetical protein H0T91_08755 [Propionibacteriaceae bacterium]|nr:hypothetical protein [Propionibacteriaceae bacterium]
MTGGRLDRAALALGLAALFSSLFGLSTGGPEPINLVHVRGVALVVILVLGAIAVLGALLHRRAIVTSRARASLRPRCSSCCRLAEKPTGWAATARHWR